MNNQHYELKTDQRTKQGGQGMLEYAILLMLVALAAVLALILFGEEIANGLKKLIWGVTEADTLTVLVLDADQEGIPGVRVFVYSDQGDYQEIHGDTDENGEVMFQLEDGRYQFLAHHQLHYFWSSKIGHPGQSMVEIQTGQAPFTVLVQNTSGVGVPGLPVHAYTDEEEYMGVSGETDENGALVMGLIETDVQFRVDVNDNSQWSDIVPTSDGQIIITLNPCGTNQFLAEYFNNRYLSGEPIITRCESTINNRWITGGPGSGVGADNFSVRWTGQFQFTAGNYSFRATADDGVRLWLDGDMMTDAWKPQSETTYATRKRLGTGIHEIKMEYYENSGNAVAVLAWEEAVESCPTGQFLAEYYNNRYLSGDPLIVRCETAVNYDWRNGSPADGLGKDYFSVRWSGTFHFDAGDYAIRTTTDDGVRLWFDNKLVIDAWATQTPTSYAYRPTLTAGEHQIKMEFFEYDDEAIAKLSWEESINSCPTGQFLAEYYNNRILNDTPVLVRCENNINYGWGSNSPASGVNADNFSVRWQGRFDFVGGPTTFTTITDDGVQLFVDGRLVISAWEPQSSVTHKATVDLSAGEHEIMLNYYEGAGNAVAKLKW